MRRLTDLQRGIVNVLVEPLTPNEIAVAIYHHGFQDVTEPQVRDCLYRLENRGLVFRLEVGPWRLTHRGLRVAGR